MATHCKFCGANISKPARVDGARYVRHTNACQEMRQLDAIDQKAMSRREGASIKRMLMFIGRGFSAHGHLDRPF